MAHRFACTVEWIGAAEGPTMDARTFSRATRVTFAGKPPLLLSAAPAFQGDAAALNPEELFTAALAACQMLSYLYQAAHNGVVVLAYTDAAEGELAVREGKLRMTRVTLRPSITISPTSDPALAASLVDRAHGECFIASSVTCEVQITPTIQSG